MSDWTDQPSTLLVSALTPVPLAVRSAIRSGPSDKATHSSYFDGLPVFRELEAGGGASRRTSLAHEAKVLFWNVERLRHIDAISATLKRVSPDVMMLCEIDRGMARSGNGDRVVELAGVLDAGYVCGVEFLELDLGDVNEKRIHAGETNLRGFHGAATLSDATMARPFLIRIDRRGDWFDGSREEPRVGGTIAIGVEVTVGNSPVLMVNVHLESHDDPAARAGDMERLLQQIELVTPNGPVILGGDFNTSTFSRVERIANPELWRSALAEEPTRLLRPERYEPLFDVAASFGYDTSQCNVPEIPTTRYPSGSTRPLAKIDWFFTRKLVARDAQVIPAIRDNGEPSSDHEGLLVTIAPLTGADVLSGQRSDW